MKNSHEGKILEELIDRFNVKKNALSIFIGQHGSFINKKIKSEELSYEVLLKIRKYFLEQFSYDIRNDFSRILDREVESISEADVPYVETANIITKQRKSITELKDEKHELVIKLNDAYEKIIQSTFIESIQLLRDEQKLLRELLISMKK
ncbi:MAG: hypothetical protein KBE86_13625 [Chitinophagales bacterium]|nr:hypothetical protein [Chitinophagales bacterium]MBP9704664.1 hypothetical protein [Chitinophagales bacterium]